MFYNFVAIFIKKTEVRSIITKLLRLLLFWFLLFLAGRILFYFCITPLLSSVPWNLIAQSFYKGLRLDWSMSGYFLLLPFIISSIYYFFRKHFLLRLIDWLNYVFLTVYTLTFVGESCLYREWKSKLSMQALEHFAHPAEVFRTTSAGLTMLFFSMSLSVMFLSIWIYNRKIAFKKMEDKGSDLKTVKRYLAGTIFFVILSGYSVISIRGGLQAIPIQNSDAYFSNYPVANDASVNPLWNLIYSMSDYMLFSKENPYITFSQADAEKITESLFEVKKDTTELFLSSARPNIVFIILESWSADCIRSFGGGDFAPFVDSLCMNSVYFTNMYSAGYVSDQGIPAVLSAYPTTSRVSIINQSSKSSKIPCINQDLKKYGYQSGFVFGGDLNYGNIKSYLFNKAFDVILEEKDMDPALVRGKLGIQDEQMAIEYLNVLNRAKQPFIYSWFTLSTHMPYDFSDEKKQLVDHKENYYINSIVYADNALKNFFDQAKKQPWFNNTLFVLVSDHSHDTHKEYNVYNPLFHRIPCIFYGNVIKPEYRGKEIKDVFSQVDILPTLLEQMGLKTERKQYVFGKNMFNPFTKRFAYNSSFSGAAFVLNSGYVGYQHGVKDPVVNTFADDRSKTDSVLNLGRAIERVIFEDYRLK